MVGQRDELQAPPHKLSEPSGDLPDPSTVSRLRKAGCVFAEEEARLLTDQAVDEKALESMLRRRVEGEPLELVLGWAEFLGRRVDVRPGVFVPRHRSELLAEAAIAVSDPGSRVLDLCCGSGAIGLSVAGTVKDIQLHACDIEPAAVASARENLRSVGGRVYSGDLFDALPEELLGGLDVIVANAPYVPTPDLGLLPREARLYEPVVSLDGGADGLSVQRRVFDGVGVWLAPGGHLLIETSDAQASLTAGAMEEAGMEPTVIASKELEATIVIAQSIN